MRKIMMIIIPMTTTILRRMVMLSAVRNRLSTTAFLMYPADTIHSRVMSSSTSTVGSEEEVAVVVNKVPKKFKPYPFQYHTELTVTVESLTNLGFGIARVPLPNNITNNNNNQDNDDNTNEEVSKNNNNKPLWVIFIPNVIPDETVRIRIYRNHATYSDADLLEIVTPSPHRIEPRCDLANVCGGCQYQHVTIERQRQFKTEQVQDLFERVGGLDRESFPKVSDTIGTDEVYEYRSKITPHYEAPMKKRDKTTIHPSDSPPSLEIGPIGFKQKASRQLIDVPHCHIATPAINKALTQIRNEKRTEAREGKLKKYKKGATLLLRDANGQVETNHTQYVTTTVKDLTFRFQAGNFFQNNPYMLPKMVDMVVEAAKRIPTKKGGGDEASNNNEMTHLIDCYCGSGLFALGCSRYFDVCVGIEVNCKAVEEAKVNAELNGIRNCDFVSASSEEIFKSQDPVRVGSAKDGENSSNDNGEERSEDEPLLLVKDFPREKTVVVVDPPRKGCSVEFLEQLDQYRPARVVYMSCDPATQARDAAFLVSHGYDIVSIQPFDLFPQTRHIECLAVFDRVDDEAPLPEKKKWNANLSHLN